MEIICDTCGSLGIAFPPKLAEIERTRHIEGWIDTRGRQRERPHPGHRVKIVPDGDLGNLKAFGFR